MRLVRRTRTLASASTFHLLKAHAFGGGFSGAFLVCFVLLVDSSLRYATCMGTWSDTSGQIISRLWQTVKPLHQLVFSGTGEVDDGLGQPRLGLMTCSASNMYMLLHCSFSTADSWGSRLPQTNDDMSSQQLEYANAYLRARRVLSVLFPGSLGIPPPGGWFLISVPRILIVLAR